MWLSFYFISIFHSSAKKIGIENGNEIKLRGCCVRVFVLALGTHKSISTTHCTTEMCPKTHERRENVCVRRFGCRALHPCCEWNNIRKMLCVVGGEGTTSPWSFTRVFDSPLFVAMPSCSQADTVLMDGALMASTMLHQQQQQVQAQSLVRAASNIASVAYFDESGKVCAYTQTCPT